MNEFKFFITRILCFEQEFENRNYCDFTLSLPQEIRNRTSMSALYTTTDLSVLGPEVLSAMSHAVHWMSKEYDRNRTMSDENLRTVINFERIWCSANPTLWSADGITLVRMYVDLNPRTPEAQLLMRAFEKVRFRDERIGLIRAIRA